MSPQDQKLMTGFGNYFETEAIAGSLPKCMNNPQKAPLGLYAEQLSGSAFTRPRQDNLRSWLYRILPSVSQGQFSSMSLKKFLTPSFEDQITSPNQMRWEPQSFPSEPTDFLEGILTILGNGHPSQLQGGSIHLYACNRSMNNRFMYNSDGELLILPQFGHLRLSTEMGILELSPGHIGVIPRGIKFQIMLLEDRARGYLLENYGQPFKLPELGPIGANGLANPRDFEYPFAHYHHDKGSFEVITKFQGQFWTSEQSHHPLDVVAWHGNLAPYRYDLTHFNTIGSISFDHPDPSIFTVLTSQTDSPGIANIDFVIFPERWMVAENTFRPPYYHRNIMSEYMGLIYGNYDAKLESFVPGGGSLHNCMAPHGPDKEAYEQAVSKKLEPELYKNTMAFMFESCLPWSVTVQAQKDDLLQKNYYQCWENLPSQFKITESF